MRHLLGVSLVLATLPAISQNSGRNNIDLNQLKLPARDSTAIEHSIEHNKKLMEYGRDYANSTREMDERIERENAEIYLSSLEANRAYAASMGETAEQFWINQRDSILSDPNFMRLSPRTRGRILAKVREGATQDMMSYAAQGDMAAAQRMAQAFGLPGFYQQQPQQPYTQQKPPLQQQQRRELQGQQERNTEDGIESVKWIRKAAEQGDAEAQSKLGTMYNKGRGVAQSDTEAVNWYRKAAEQGDAKAQNNLGVMYVSGRGVAQSVSEAGNWFRKAADQGVAEAQLNLGAMYENGYGVAQSHADAMKWYTKAAAQGNENAKKALAALKNRTK